MTRWLGWVEETTVGRLIAQTEGHSSADGWDPPIGAMRLPFVLLTFSISGMFVQIGGSGPEV